MYYQVDAPGFSSTESLHLSVDTRLDTATWSLQTGELQTAGCCL